MSFCLLVALIFCLFVCLKPSLLSGMDRSQMYIVLQVQLTLGCELVFSCPWFHFVLKHCRRMLLLFHSSKRSSNQGVTLQLAS